MFYISSNIRTIIVSVVLCLLLLGAISLGITSGKKKSFSESMSVLVQEHIKALNFYYQDNSRFPTADELVGQSFKSKYYNQEPRSFTQVGDCPGSIVYTRPSFNTYQLDFCLEKQVGGYKEGWNQLVDSK